MKTIEEVNKTLQDKIEAKDAIKKEYKDKKKTKPLTEIQRIERIEKLLGLL